MIACRGPTSSLAVISCARSFYQRHRIIRCEFGYRFFPEVAAGIARARVERFVLDGELVIPGQSFDTLQLRLHPAASRILELSAKFPARLIVFDLFQFGNARLTEKPLSERRGGAESVRQGS
jgi:ATP-dependent DNA ligase